MPPKKIDYGLKKARPLLPDRSAMKQLMHSPQALQDFARVTPMQPGGTRPISLVAHFPLLNK